MRRALALALLGLGVGAGAAAQTVTARLGGELTAVRYGTVIVPVAVDMSASGGERLGSYTARLAWNPAVLQPCFDQYCGAYNLAGNFPLPQFNTDSAVNGVVRFTAISPAGVGGLVTIGQIPFQVLDTVASPLDLSFSEMSAAGTFVNLLPTLTVSSGTFCPARGRWGDLDGDDHANSRDALLTLSAVVGLPVDTIYDTGLADVNADGQIQSVDALIILSYAVGLDIPGQRVLLLAPTSCGTGSARTLSVFPAAAQLVPNQALPLLLQARDSAGRQVTVSDAVWRSSDYGVATVDGAGVVTPRAPGTATITGEVGPGVRASATVTVIARRPNWIVDSRATGAAVQLGNATFPMDHPVRAFAFVTEGDTIRVASGTYDFTNRSGQGDVAPIQPGAARSATFNFDDDVPLDVGVVIVGGTPGDTTTRPVFRAEQYYAVRGLWLRGGAKTTVRNVVFRNLDPAIELDGVRNFALEDSRIDVADGSYGDGIYSCTSTSMDTVRVDRSVLVGDSSSRAVYFGGCSSDAAARLLLIRDSKLLQWGDGVYEFDVDSTVVLNSEISDNDGYGILTRWSNSANPSLYVAHSRIERNYYTAIYGYQTRRVVVDTSVIRSGTSDDAISVSGGCGECGGDTMLQVYLRGDSIYVNGDDYNWLYAANTDSTIIAGTVVRFPDSASFYAYGNIYGRVGRVTSSQFLNVGSGVDLFYFNGRDFFADTVTMTGCTEPVSGCDEGYGFELYSNSGVLDARVRNSTFTNIGYPLYAGGGSGGIHEATNLVMDSVRYGIQIGGDSIIVRNNTITRVWTLGISTGGFAGLRGASTIANNTITCIVPPDESSPVAIRLFSQHAFNVDSNLVETNCGYGVSISGVRNGTTLRGNTLRAGGNFGVFVNQFDSSLITLDRNAISGGFAAVQIANGRVAMAHNNVGNGNYYGIYIPFATGYTQIVSDSNAFVGNNNYSIYAPFDVVDATNNWWGDPAGPGGGIADSVSGAGITTVPFLAAAPAGLPAFAPKLLGTFASAAPSRVASPAPERPVRPVRSLPAAKPSRAARPILPGTSATRAAQIRRAEAQRAAAEAERTSRQERRRRPS
jgi:hypothetical protein